MEEVIGKDAGKVISKDIRKNIIKNSTIKRAGSRPSKMKKSLWLYIFLIPGILCFLVFNYFPMYGVKIAFMDYSPIKGFADSPWVGLQNFRYLFSTESFYNVFKNSLVLSFLRLICGFPMPIILALMLNELRMKRFKKFSQTVLYVPYFISWVVLGGLIMNLLSPANGPVNNLIEMLGGERIAFLQSETYFRAVLIISDIWKTAGWGTIVYMAAISGIDAQMYEAASIEGAGMLRQMWHITLPTISPTIMVLLILQMGSVVKNGFEQIFMLYSPSVYSVADVFETYTYRMGLMEGRLSFSTAVGLFQSVVGLILVLTTNKVAQKIGEGEGALW